MTSEEFRDSMAEIAGPITRTPEGRKPARVSEDPEVTHAHADNLMVEVLREMGFGEGLDIYDQIAKWYA